MRCSAILAMLLSGCAYAGPAPADYRFDNGLWYQDGSFIEQTVFVRDGRIEIGDNMARAVQTIDLDGSYVIPPFCEAHNHNFGGSAENVTQTAQAYLQTGVYYAFMPGSFVLYRERIKSRLNTPQSVDVIFANNGLTGPGGHPRGLRESLKERFGLYPEFTVEELADTGYFEAADRGQMLRKWELIKAEQTDVIKVMLYFSEEYEQRKVDPDYFGRRGLDPALLPELISLAHSANLRVAVHVESEADMVTAIGAGADIIAHLPSYDAPVRLSQETIALAASHPNVALVTTFSRAKRVEISDPEGYAAIIAAQKDNLRRLIDAGANVIVGSDNTRDTSRGEADHLGSLDVLAPATLLEMWGTNCSQTLFPDRRLGRLASGYEASFLALDGNPLDDFENTKNIRWRVKDGQLLPFFP